MQAGEGVALGLPLVGKQKCPICERDPHPTTKDGKKGKPNYKSVPKNLGCNPIKQSRDIANYSTAAHHLICANQCFKKFPRLTQMAWIVGYDINGEPNGLSLPTVGQKKKNKYFPEGVKFGKLEVPRQRDVSFEIMEHLDATPGDYGSQWHVGHHDWSWDKVELLLEDTDSLAHGPNYEDNVNKDLRELERKIVRNKASYCDPDDDDQRGKQVASDLDALSGKIKSGIKGWSKYFVSAASFAYQYNN
jgi:hypothetical protein